MTAGFQEFDTKRSQILNRCIGPFIVLALAFTIEVLTQTSYRIPNPPALLIMIVVFATFTGGMGSGLVTSALAWIYIAYFFSIGGEPFHYTDENIRRVAIWAITIPLITLMVGHLKNKSVTAAQASASRNHERQIHEREAELQQTVNGREERERLTEALRAKTALLDAILSCMGSGVVVMEQTGQVSHLNPAAQAILGINQDEVLGTTASEIRTRGFSKVFRDDSLTLCPMDQYPIIRALGGECVEEVMFVRTMRRTEGIWVSVIATPIMIDGTQFGAVSVFHEVTNLKKLEIQLAASSKELARSNVELEQFAYVASHDMQEPLRAITNYVELIAQRCETLDDRTRGHIQHVVEGTTRMQEFIRDLLAYARLRDAGSSEDVDMAICFDDVLRGLQIAIRNAGASVTRTQLPIVAGYPGLIKQVLQNLVGNALKFRSTAAPNIHFSFEREGEEFVFSLADNGIGIPEAHRDRVFVIFQRLHTRDEYSGTGIGLAICKKVIDQHGGRIWAEAVPGGGSVFRFTLPMHAQADASGQEGLSSENET